MGVTENLMPKALMNQVSSELSQYTVQSGLKSANSQLERAQSIFTQRQSDFTGSETTFLTRVFEKALAESSYSSMKDALSHLRSKERAFDSTNKISTNKFINHEQKLQQTSEIQGIETQISENQSKIQEKQKALSTKANVETSYQNALNVSILLAKEISQLQNTEITIVNDIETIKSQLQQIKSGNFSISSLQLNLTGSTSTSSIDTSKLLNTNSSSVAVLGGQQFSGNKALQDLLASYGSSDQVSQVQEEIEAQIRSELIGMLEDLLSQKENQLTNTRTQIKQKQAQLYTNDKKVDSLEKDNSSNVSDRTSLEEEIEQLIKETEALVNERLEKDPQLIKFSSFSNFFTNFLKGNGETGAGVASDLTRARKDFEEKAVIYEEKSFKTGSAESIYGVQSFLKTTARLNLNTSKAKTEEQKKLFESVKLKRKN